MKQWNILITSTFILLISATTAKAQEGHFKCGLQDKLPAIYEAYPGFEQDQQELIARSKNYTTTRGGERAESYVIPVVFHVIHEHGAENISDAQLLDQMAILNRDFKKLNPDTVEIVDEFVDLAADTHIEFRLANKDPFGNCTNGIDRIYSYETNNGDDFSKLNQWPRNRYLNVWIVNSMRDGVAGYAYYPSAVDGGLQFADGIIILHDYIGSIGTANETRSRALTHEIGHWLGLPHTWGNNNNPGVTCGDDGIEDTPETAGYVTCALDDSENCTVGVIENVQNYMEYSYCSNMFTLGQKDVMVLTLETPLAGRNNLHTETNRMNGGIIGDPLLCTPLPDFYMDGDLTCVGNSITFKPAVSRAEVTEYSWVFPGGTPATSNLASPEVTYNSPGVYDVQLTVTNAAGSETLTKTQFAHVLGDYWKYDGPYTENFENDHFNTAGWYVFNDGENEVKWDLVEYAGRSGNQCIGLEYYKNDPNPILYPHYYERQGGARDAVVSPPFNLSNTSGSVLNFNYIFATVDGGIFEPQNMELVVSYWKECEDSWTILEILNGDDLVCAGHYYDLFKPTGSDNWQSVSINLPSGVETSSVRFKIELTAADKMNNFYIDDFNISGLLTDGRKDLLLQNVNLYPNPGTGEVVNISYYSSTVDDVNITVYDMLGNVLLIENFDSHIGINVKEISLSNTLFSSGIYNVVLTSDGSSVTKRLSIK